MDGLKEKLYSLSEVLLAAHPVGSYYWSDDPTSPEILFGGGWTQITDKFVLAAGSSYAAGSTGGEASHTLTVNEMPSHAHTEQLCAEGYSGWGSYTTTSYGIIFDYSSSAYGINYHGVGTTYNSASVAANADTLNTGGGVAHNNMPPYVVAYCWKRTA